MSTLYQSYANFNTGYMVYTHLVLEKIYGLKVFCKKIYSLVSYLCGFCPGDSLRTLLLTIQSLV